MSQLIVVAGATGNLGNKICQQLVERGATVVAMVRSTAKTEKKDHLSKLGVKLVEVDFSDTSSIAAACADAKCVVSAVAGLGDVIIDLQGKILDGALQSGVPRFIPSDFCTDFNQLEPGTNRNFDLRRTFRRRLDDAPIKASSIFNGAFADILKYNTPVLNVKDNSISYWGDKENWKLDFTTMDDTAAFTAEVALDDNAPRDLHIASFQVSPRMIWSLAKELTGKEFVLRQLSGMEAFATAIREQRAANPAGENELYAKWQQSQYLYCMFTAQHPELSNGRYDNISYTAAKDFLATFLRKNEE